MRTHLIAETGASGEVVWVWMKRPGQPTARPVTPAVASRLTLDHTEISGAPRAAVLAWVQRVSAQRTDGPLTR